MAVADMPVKELEKYQGTNPRPGDFDAYWKDALAEMKAAASQVHMTKSEFQSPTVECYDMYFTGVNGARIYVKHLRPKHISGKIPAVLQFHGYSVDSGSWVEKLSYAASGCAVFAMDVRGQGGRSEDVGGVLGNTHHGHIIRGLQNEDPHKLFYRNVFLDTAQLAGIVMNLDFVDETKVYTHGGSQGGALALACAALEPGIAKAAVFYPFLSDYQRVWEMDAANSAYAEINTWFMHFDPQHKREKELFTKLGYIDIQHLAPRIQGDTLLFTCLMDTACPPSTQYAVYHKLNCRKKHILYPEYGHEAPCEAVDLVYDFLVNDKF